MKVGGPVYRIGVGGGAASSVQVSVPYLYFLNSKKVLVNVYYNRHFLLGLIDVLI